MTGEMSTTRYILVWFNHCAISSGSVMSVRREIEDLVTESPDSVEVDVWLESPGGDANAAFKLALLLRHISSKVRVVVPDTAKSAATLLALSGHEIYMAPAAELGPLDAQLFDEGSVHRYTSALNIARAADEVARDAVTLAGTGGAELLNRTGLSRAQTLDAMLRFAARFSEPLVRQIDPKSVHDAKQMLRVTVRYAEYLLENTIDPPEMARHIAHHLVRDFPSHDFVISIDDANKLRLPVRPITEYDLLDQVRATHRIYEDDGEPLISFTSLADLLDTGEEGEGGQDEEPSTNGYCEDTEKSIEASVKGISSEFGSMSP